ncbi:MAG TPA: hydrogenase [Clostridia bacterium]|nr:hydrogenase [Clostridia bacterium]
MSTLKELEKEKRFTRRSFLKMLTSAGIIGATASLTGCTIVDDTAGTGWLPEQYEIPGSWPVQVRGRVPLDPLNPSLIRNDQKCILCGQCLEVCQQVQSVFGYYDLPVFDDFVCVHCGQCALWCPTAAITERNDIAKVREALADPEKIVIVQTAPATRVGLGEEFGLPAGAWVEGRQVAALRRLGFDYVFDTNFTADLTIMEEGTELIQRMTGKIDAPLPQFTSCCPGWIKFFEYFYPDLKDHISSAKSPMQMAGAVIKTHFASTKNIDPGKIVSVAIMPCTAKKFEAQRPEFNASGKYWGKETIRDVDYVLTTRELARMLKEDGINLPELPEEKYDPLLGEGSGAALIFGNTGGVMEAAVRSVYYLLTGHKAPAELFDFQPVRGLQGIKEGSVDIPGVGTLRVAVVHGLGNARVICESAYKNNLPYHFIEIMACPGGCISGGGQPRTSVPPADYVREQRMASMYQKDEAYVLRESYENKEVLELYQTFLQHPMSELAHELLHTAYTSRAGKLTAKRLA